MTHCWFDRAHQILDSASESHGIRESFSLMTDGEVAKFCFSSIPWDDSLAFGKALAENSVLRLPFPRCYFQYGPGYGSQLTVTGLFVSEFETDDGLLWFIWRAMKCLPSDPDGEGYGVMSYVNISALSEGSSKFIKNPLCYDGQKFLNESNISNLDEALSCVAYLGFKGVSTELIAPKAAVNARRAKHGRHILPTYHVVKVRGVIPSHSSGGGNHASPVPHWRRGHVRVLPSGKATIVRPHPVMGGVSSMPTYDV